MKMQLKNADKITLSHPVDIWLVMQRILRGKSDQLDAKRIAQYAYRFKDKAQL